MMDNRIAKFSEVCGMTVSELIEIMREERDLWLEERAEARQREVGRDLVDELEGV